MLTKANGWQKCSGAACIFSPALAGALPAMLTPLSSCQGQSAPMHGRALARLMQRAGLAAAVPTVLLGCSLLFCGGKLACATGGLPATRRSAQFNC